MSNLIALQSLLLRRTFYKQTSVLSPSSHTLHTHNTLLHEIHSWKFKVVMTNTKFVTYLKLWNQFNYPQSKFVFNSGFMSLIFQSSRQLELVIKGGNILTLTWSWQEKLWFLFQNSDEWSNDRACDLYGYSLRNQDWRISQQSVQFSGDRSSRQESWWDTRWPVFENLIIPGGTFSGRV